MRAQLVQHGLRDHQAEVPREWKRGKGPGDRGGRGDRDVRRPQLECWSCGERGHKRDVCRQEKVGQRAQVQRAAAASSAQE